MAVLLIENMHDPFIRHISPIHFESEMRGVEGEHRVGKEEVLGANLRVCRKSDVGTNSISGMVKLVSFIHSSL